MGTECFNGHNKDIDLLSDTSTIEKTIQLNSKKNLKESNSTGNLKINKNVQQKRINYNKGRKISKSPNKTISNNTRTNSLKVINYGKKKIFHKFTREELEDKINDILRIRIPFFDNSFLKTISALAFLSGNGPYHEGLLFFTANKNFYIAQSYPISFVKVFDYYQGISDIISFNRLNNNSKEYNIPEIYFPKDNVTILDIVNIIEKLPNKYNLFNNNCQNFCDNILKSLIKNYKIEMDDKPNIEKINYLKNQKQIKGYKLPYYI